MVCQKQGFFLVFFIFNILILNACIITEGSPDFVSEETTITVEAEPPPATTSSQPIVPPTREDARRVAGIPAGRSSSTMTYDSDRQVVLMFGGINLDTGALADIWEYDGNNWYRVETVDSPPPRAQHEMAYDPHRNVTVLFGGEVQTESGWVVYGDLWEYDGITWQEVTASEMPEPRSLFAMTYYLPEEAIILIGGTNRSVGLKSQPILSGKSWLYDELWWSGGIHIQDSRNDNLLGYYFNLGSPEIVYDTRREKLIVLYGQKRLATLEFDGVNWEEREAAGFILTESEAANFGNYAVSFDQRRGVTVLFGGLFTQPNIENILSNDTWEYDGEVWVEVTPTNLPTARWGHSMIYDEAREVIVLFGGIDVDGNLLDDTWEYDGSTWTQRFFDN